VIRRLQRNCRYHSPDVTAVLEGEKAATAAMADIKERLAGCAANRRRKCAEFGRAAGQRS